MIHHAATTVLLACLVSTNILARAEQQPESGFSAATASGGFLKTRAESLEERVTASLASLKADAATDKIEAKMWKSSLALPRNLEGRFEHQAVKYLVHTYFAQEHGWVIQGLGKYGPRQNSSELHNAGILKDKAPVLLAALLESQQSGRGLSLRDAAMMAAALERLIVTEALGFLELAYMLNGQQPHGSVNAAELKEILLSFLLLWELGQTEEVVSPEVHPLLKEELARSGDSFWEQLGSFQEETTGNFVFARRHTLNPFEEARFAFEDASSLVEALINNYGRWQNSECQLMKAELMALDSRGFGRVPISSFYSQPETAQYKFGESVDYLRTIGALDEVHFREPHVVVANFVAGPSNCVAGSEFFSVCCLAECETLMSDIEGEVQAPTATPEEVLKIVSNLDSATIESPRVLPTVMVKRLEKIAEHHGGQVPLHGRLFAQWMHYAFPLECQNPVHLENEDVLTPAHWEESGHSATDEEKDKYIALAGAAADNSFFSLEENTAGGLELQWSDEDILPFHGQRSTFSARFVMRCVMQIAMLLAGLKFAADAWSTASNKVRNPQGDAKLEKAHYV
eukprot:TRINITY_DN100760_c0_g1_i1.p2 TRINITY_DN100760_c0_g1~~TRINITY_DN100760_c0_g1_i1.p2  ORF type:complete len:572 (-),score=194.51 TRINITY_DN100760_c0_g1_i1:86-1801(-)